MINSINFYNNIIFQIKKTALLDLKPQHKKIFAIVALALASLAICYGIYCRYLKFTARIKSLNQLDIEAKRNDKDLVPFENIPALEHCPILESSKIRAIGYDDFIINSKQMTSAIMRGRDVVYDRDILALRVRATIPLDSEIVEKLKNHHKNIVKQVDENNNIIIDRVLVMYPFSETQQDQWCTSFGDWIERTHPFHIFNSPLLDPTNDQLDDKYKENIENLCTLISTKHFEYDSITFDLC